MVIGLHQLMDFWNKIKSKILLKHFLFEKMPGYFTKTENKL